MNSSYKPHYEDIAIERPFTGSYSRRRVNQLQSFGWVSIVSLFVATGVVFACVAFLCFLWVSDNSNTVWKRIVISGWVTRSITITSLFLRWAITTQATICTSMIAGLLLNSFQTTLPNAAAISSMRFLNAGPRSLLAYLPRTLRLRSLILGAIVLLMTIVTVLLQFTSTALLSNVGAGLISEPQYFQNLPYGYNSDSQIPSQIEGIGYLGSKPVVYPAFAEYSESTTYSFGVSDTGLSIRGFIPIGVDASRNLVQNYSGMATLIDTRVVCMRPTVSNVSVSAIISDTRITGSISTTLTPPRFNRTSTAPSKSTFNCTWAVQGAFQTLYANNNEWPIAMCSLDMENEGLISAMSPLLLPPNVLFNPGDAFLLINSTGTFGEWGPINNAGGSTTLTGFIAREEWLEVLTTNPKLSLQLTLCYTNFVVQDTRIEAWRASENATEPVSGWNNLTATFETAAVRKQLGATAPVLTPKERGIFNLVPKSSWERPPSLNYTATGWTSINPISIPETVLLSATRGLSGTTLMCGFCQPGGQIKTARINSAIFNDVMRDTRNPALAVQSLFTTLFGLAYYDLKFQFDASAPANITSSVSVIKPTGWALFIAVITGITLHMALVVLVTVLFLFAGGNSLLGNAWAAMAQLYSPETKEWLDMASDKTDREVKKAMAATGRHGLLVGIVNSENGPQLRSR